MIVALDIILKQGEGPESTKEKPRSKKLPFPYKWPIYFATWLFETINPIYGSNKLGSLLAYPYI